MGLVLEELSKREKTTVAVEDSINEYLEQKDWRVQANANQGYSLRGINPQYFRENGRKLLAELHLSLRRRPGP